MQTRVSNYNLRLVAVSSQAGNQYFQQLIVNPLIINQLSSITTWTGSSSKPESAGCNRSYSMHNLTFFANHKRDSLLNKRTRKIHVI